MNKFRYAPLGSGFSSMGFFRRILFEDKVFIAGFAFLILYNIMVFSIMIYRQNQIKKNPNDEKKQKKKANMAAMSLSICTFIVILITFLINFLPTNILPKLWYLYLIIFVWNCSLYFLIPVAAKIQGGSRQFVNVLFFFGIFLANVSLPFFNKKSD